MNLKFRFWLIACLLLLTSTPAFAQKFAQTRHIRVEVTPKDKSHFLQILKSNLDVTHAHGAHIDILVSQAELSTLRAEGAQIEILNPNVYGSERGSEWLPEYLSFADVEKELNDLASTYPDLTELTVIGTSVEGRNIYALKISDNASVDEDEGEVLLIGNHHAREVITPIICMHVAKELLSSYGANPAYTDWVDNREIWIVPVLNPDGYVYVETVNLFWRKNRRDNPGDDEGVDLNRNWGFKWGYNDIGSSGNYSSGVYRGKAPFSEPETDALQQFVMGREFTIAMTFHSFSNLLLWGPGYRPAYSRDNDIYSAMGEIVASQNNYIVGNPADGAIYSTNGDCTDWLYNVAGVIAFTPEVGDSFDYFNPPAKRIPVLIQEGSVCAWEAIRYGDRPGQLAPPGQPIFNEIGQTSGDYTVTWNAPVEADTEVVAYELVEKTGAVVVVEGAEDGAANIDLNGWIVTSDFSKDGGFSLSGGAFNGANHVCFSKEAYVVQSGDAFTFDARFDIETEYDYLYAVVSTDGKRSYEAIEGTFTTLDNPTGRNADHGITGNSGGWQEMSFDLSDYVGQSVWLGLRYSTDGAQLGEGVWVDNLHPIQTWTTSTVIDSNINDTQYSITGKPAGEYYYTLRGLDAEGEWGYPSECASAIVSEQFVVVPSSFLVTRGQYASGLVEDTHASDNVDLRVLRSSTDVQSRTEVEVVSNSPLVNPGSMTVVLESSVFARTTVNQTIELFNFSTNQWEAIDTRVAARFTDASVSVDVTGDISRFVESGPNSIKARVRYQSTRQRQGFSSNIDLLSWTIGS